MTGKPKKAALPRLWLGWIRVGQYLVLEATTDPTSDPRTLRARGESYTIGIEAPLTISAAGQRHEITPQDYSSLGPILKLALTWFETSRVTEDVLQLRFDEGTIVTVDPHPQYESWHVSGPGGLEWDCPPGGTRQLR